jgi:hypothetical protein
MLFAPRQFPNNVVDEVGTLTAGFMKPRRLGKIERLGSCPPTTEQKYCSRRQAIESLLIVWRLFASEGCLSLEALPCCDQFRGVIDPLVKGGGEGKGEIAREARDKRTW